VWECKRKVERVGEGGCPRKFIRVPDREAFVPEQGLSNKELMGEMLSDYVAVF
jgi:hypothetical protein